MLVQPFHLSSISVDCSAEVVVGYCRGNGIAVTGCFFLPAKIWHGIRTAKLVAVPSAKEQLLMRSFWPQKPRRSSCKPLTPRMFEMTLARISFGVCQVSVRSVCATSRLFDFEIFTATLSVGVLCQTETCLTNTKLSSSISLDMSCPFDVTAVERLAEVSPYMYAQGLLLK